jgi:phosphoserine phosphatase RsbU/P
LCRLRGFRTGRPQHQRYLAPFARSRGPARSSCGGSALQLCYVNAGHNPPLILRKSAVGCQVLRLETGGPVIGLLPQCYEQESFPLVAGDLAVLFTDGVSESMNGRDEEWSEERLIEFAKTCPGLPAYEVMTRILAAAEAFAAGAPQHDDMTLVAVRVLT